MVDETSEARIKVVVDGEEQVNKLTQAYAALNREMASVKNFAAGIGSVQMPARVTDAWHRNAPSIVAPFKSAEPQVKVAAEKFGREVIGRSLRAPFEVLGATAKVAGASVLNFSGAIGLMAVSLPASAVAITAFGAAAAGLLPVLFSVIASVKMLGASFQWAGEAADEAIKVRAAARRYYPGASGLRLQQAENAIDASMSTLSTFIGESALGVQDRVNKRLRDVRLGKGLAGDRDIFERWGINQQSRQAFEQQQGKKLDLTDWARQFIGLRESLQKQFEAAPAGPQKNHLGWALSQMAEDTALIFGPKFADLVQSMSSSAFAKLQRNITASNKLGEAQNYTAESAINLKIAQGSLVDSFEQIKKGIGKDVTPALTDFLDFLNEKLVGGLGENLRKLGSQISIQSWRTLTELFKQLEPSITKMTASLAQGDPEKTAANIIAFGTAVGELAGHLWEAVKATNAMLSAIIGYWQWIGEHMKAAAPSDYEGNPITGYKLTPEAQKRADQAGKPYVAPPGYNRETGAWEPGYGPSGPAAPPAAPAPTGRNTGWQRRGETTPTTPTPTTTPERAAVESPFGGYGPGGIPLAPSGPGMPGAPGMPPAALAPRIGGGRGGFGGAPTGATAAPPSGPAPPANAPGPPPGGQAAPTVAPSPINYTAPGGVGATGASPTTYMPAPPAGGGNGISPARAASPGIGEPIQVPSGGGGEAPPPAAGGVGPQAALAYARQHLGEDEIKDQGKLQQFFKAKGVPVNPKTTAWCAAFVNANLKQAGIKGTGSLAAGSFTNYGTAVQPGDVQAGDIGVVKGRSPRTGVEGRHVGFLTGQTRMGPNGLEVEMLGGNQGGTVSKQGGVSRQWRSAASLHMRRPPAPTMAGEGTPPPVQTASLGGAGGVGMGGGGGGQNLTKSPFSPNVQAAITKASAETGVDAGMLHRFAEIESSGKPGAKTGSYKGLFQLSNTEFQKYNPGGDIYSAQDNATAGARKLARETKEFEAKYKRKPEGYELYLQHQQGPGGLAQHLAQPDRPAWQSMLATGEGRKKGEGWAKRAVWGNVPDSQKARFGNVENMTSGQFTEMWKARYERASTGGATKAVAEQQDLGSATKPTDLKTAAVPYADLSKQIGAGAGNAIDGRKLGNEFGAAAAARFKDDVDGVKVPLAADTSRGVPPRSAPKPTGGDTPTEA